MWNRRGKNSRLGNLVGAQNNRVFWGKSLINTAIQ